MNAIVEKPRTAAPNRVEQERSRRRRRDDLGAGRMLKLSVAGNKDPNYEYRWVNDDPGRIYQLTQSDDWDRVTTSDLGEANPNDKSVGTGVEVIVDKVSGKRAVLLRKPKSFYLEDKAKEQARLEDTESSLKRGKVESPEALAGPASYVPAGGIAISNGTRS